LYGVLAALINKEQIAKDQLKKIKKLNSSYSFGEIPYHLSRIETHLPNEKKALNNLEEAVSKGAKFYINNVFENDPIFNKLKLNPQFQKITHPLGIESAKH
ncbi:MAG: hypothetical protein AAGK97_01885, partial [Bacteroidota bacterium]